MTNSGCQTAAVKLLLYMPGGKVYSGFNGFLIHNQACCCCSSKLYNLKPFHRTQFALGNVKLPLFEETPVL